MNARARRARAVVARRGRISRGMARRRRERWFLIEAGPDRWVWMRLWVTPQPLPLQLSTMARALVTW